MKISFNDILEALSLAKPAELREVRETLAAAPEPAPAPGRAAMDAEERRALRAEYEQGQAGSNARYEAAQAGVERIERERAALEERALAACQGQFDADAARSEWVRQWREGGGRRLWESRPALVDELIARLRAEA